MTKIINFFKLQSYNLNNSANTSIRLNPKQSKMKNRIPFVLVAIIFFTSFFGLKHCQAQAKTAMLGVNGLTCSACSRTCLLYTSDAADERSSVDLGGRRIIKKKKKK